MDRYSPTCKLASFENRSLEVRDNAFCTEAGLRVNPIEYTSTLDTMPRQVPSVRATYATDLLLTVVIVVNLVLGMLLLWIYI